MGLLNKFTPFWEITLDKSSGCNNVKIDVSIPKHRTIKKYFLLFSIKASKSRNFTLVMVSFTFSISSVIICLRSSFLSSKVFTTLSYADTSSSSLIGFPFTSTHAWDLKGFIANPVHQLARLFKRSKNIITPNDLFTHPSWFLHLRLTVHIASRANTTSFSVADNFESLNLLIKNSILVGEIFVSG